MALQRESGYTYVEPGRLSQLSSTGSSYMNKIVQLQGTISFRQCSDRLPHELKDSLPRHRRQDHEESRESGYFHLIPRMFRWPSEIETLVRPSLIGWQTGECLLPSEFVPGANTMWAVMW